MCFWGHELGPLLVKDELQVWAQEISELAEHAFAGVFTSVPHKKIMQ